MALENFALGKHDVDYICFQEELQIVMEDEDLPVIGSIHLSVEIMDVPNDMLIVHTLSKMKTMEMENKMSTTSFVDFNLATWEEKQTGRISTRYKDRDCSLYLGRCEEILHCVVRIDDKRQATSFPVDDTADLVGEGANVVLLRYIAQTGFQGEMETSMISISGQKLSCQYYSDGEKEIFFNGKNIHAVLVVCRAVLANEEKQVTITTLNRHGRILEHTWVSTPYKAKPLPKLRLEERWQEDEQLFSLYLDSLNRNRFEIRSYLTHCPEIKAILTDMVTNTLLLQPSDAIAFMTEQLSVMTKEPLSPDTSANRDVNSSSQIEKSDKTHNVY